MQGPRLPKDGADRRMGVDQGPYVGVIFGSAFDPAGGAERSDERILPLHRTCAFEEFHVLGVRARPASFNKRYPEFIQLLCDANLVIARKREAFRLGPITEGCVVNLYKG